MLDFEGYDIQVAVRLRPMNRQESEKGTKRIVQIDDHTTTSITNPEDPSDFRSFGFGHCYWSYDGFTELADGHLVPDGKHLNGGKYCDQKRVFDHFGREIVQNAWAGYNSTLICYGESQSGKSWSLFGNASNKGIISLVASELFKGLREKEKGPQVLGNSNEIKISMLEIYDNKVRDLLLGNNSTKFRHSIKIREHPKRGFYVEGLRLVLVSNAEEVQQRIEEGVLNRAMTSTNLNLICNQSTVVVGISLVQKYKNVKGDEVTLSALLDFYDLAGSQSSEISGIHEPNSRSIRNLNHCVSSLIEQSLGKRIAVPFMESTLTKMLERSITGNCRTYTIATISPADLNYKESLLTLLFADKLQRLKTHPVINEELTIKLVRELKLENENLRKMLSSGDFDKNDFFAWSDKLDSNLLSTDKDDFKRQIVDDIKSQIKDNDKEIKSLTQSQEERLKLAKLDKPSDSVVAFKKLETEKKNKPHIFNLNSDTQLSGRLIHIILPGITDFGNQIRKDPFVFISGPGVRENHGTFAYNHKDNKVSIKPIGPECLIFVNGQQILFETSIFHNDRIAIRGQIWIFQNPREPWADKNPPTRLTYQFAQEEIVLKSKLFSFLYENGNIIHGLKAEIFSLFPLIEDANAMSEDLEKWVHFEIVVIKNVQKLINNSEDSVDVMDEEGYDKLIMVKLVHFKEEMDFFWSKSKFLLRFDIMKSTFLQVQEDGIVNTGSNLILDPFMEDLTTEVPIGYGLVSLKSIAYLVELQQSIDILDFIELKPVGNVKVEILPCNEFFEKLNDAQVFITSPRELIGKSLSFVFKMGSSENFPSKYKDVYCKYKFNSESSEISTGRLDSKSSYALGSLFKYERKFSFDNVTATLLDYLEKDLLVLTFYGVQRPKKLRNMFSSEQSEYCNRHGNPESLYLGEGQKQVADLAVFKKSEARLQQKLEMFKSLLKECDELSQTSVPVEYIRNILFAPNAKEATEILTAFRDEYKPPEEVEPVRKLTTYQKISEVCSIT